jgi:hypothetical protein
MMEQNAQRSLEAARAAADPQRIAAAHGLVEEAKGIQAHAEEPSPPG